MKNRIKRLNRYQKILLLILAVMALVFTVLYVVNIDKVYWTYWLLGLFFCVLNAVEILFANEVFRFWVSLRVKNAREAEPSDWAVKVRYIGWTFVTVTALGIFIMGLIFTRI